MKTNNLSPSKISPVSPLSSSATTPTPQSLKPLTIGIAVITHNAERHLKNCLPPLLASPLKPRVLVVNSSSEDNTVLIAQSMGAETLVIPRSEFNHGLTREKARQHLKTDIVVMMTPDAYAVDKSMIDRLITPLITGQASISYARQLPHHGANFFESFLREFNYPSESHIRSIKDVSVYGPYTFFCSDSCAAYKNEALDSVGGFPEVLIGEDTVVTAKLLKKGHKIAYVAEALVHHSHSYNLRQEFQRHFDTGLARKGFEDLIKIGGSDAKRGRDYVQQLMRQLIHEKPLWIPYACLQTIMKWIGYQCGVICVRAPYWVKKRLSGQDFYWKNRKSF